VSRFARWLAFLGAVTVILAIAVEPFSQAALDYYSCPQLVSQGTARIPISNYFEPSLETIRSSSRVLDVESQISIYKGLLDPAANSSSSMAGKVDCITGNCTFPQDSNGAVFATLAMCSACTDITAHLNRTEKKGRRNETEAIVYSLPSGAETEIWRTPRSGVQALHVVDVYLNNSEASLENWPVYTMEGVMIRQKNCTASITEARNCTGYRKKWENPSAASCSLLPCMKTYHANVMNGAYSETELSVRNLQNIGVGRSLNMFAPYHWLVTDTVLRDGAWLACNATSQNTTANTIEVFATNKSSCLRSRNGGCGESTNTLWYPRHCVWEAGEGVWNLMPDLISELVHNKTVWSLDDDNEASVTGEPYLRRLYFGDEPAITKFERFMAGLATALTARIRTFSAGTEAVQPVHGDVWRADICYEVRWTWLIYLATMLALEIIFLLSVMLVPRLGGWNLDWKSSALATVFHRLDEKLYESSEGLSTKKRMEEAAKRLEVHLVETNGHWQLGS
jgi:hypothetical protein